MRVNRFKAMIALGRIGKVAGIADVVAFLTSDDARWVNGQNIRVNGGLIGVRLGFLPRIRSIKQPGGPR